jgi:uncharacterized RDD family membrane protein YckC
MSLKSKKIVAWLIDYIPLAGLISLFHFFAVFYEQQKMMSYAYSMVLCAVISIFLLTIYVPFYYQMTLGERLMHIKTYSQQGPLNLRQVLLRDLIARFLLGEFLLVFSIIYTFVFPLVHITTAEELPIESFMHLRVETVS